MASRRVRLTGPLAGRTIALMPKAAKPACPPEVQAMSKQQEKGTKRSGRANAVSAGSIGEGGPDESETMRLQLLAEVGEAAPGQLETLLDRAYLADSFFEEHVLQDPACLRSPALFREAWAVAQVLADFYQRVGQEVGKEPVVGASADDAARANP
jgi:hypothetical protein